MFKVGLTGGIGSGKTTIAKIFQKLGVPIYYYDDAAKRLYDTEPDLIEQIKNMFWRDIYVDWKLDRKKLAAIVFGDDTKLQLLHRLLKPFLQRDVDYWLSKQNADYVIFETAILFESKLDEQMDYIVCVHAAEDVRLKRAMERDLATEGQIRARMAKQIDETERIERSNFTIVNTNIRLTEAKVNELHEDLQDLATSK